MELHTLSARISTTYDLNKVTFYSISLYHSTTKSNWSVDRRYSEFDSLFNSLNTQFDQVPPLPGKAFWKKFSSTFLQDRVNHLAQFIVELVNRQDLLQTVEVQLFFGIEKNVPGFRVNSVDEVSHQKFNQVPVGIVSLDLDYVVIGLNPGNFERIKLSLVEGQQSAVLCQKLTGELVWTIRFPLKISCLGYSKELTILGIGFENGGISAYRIKSELDFAEYEEFTYVNPHHLPVIGIVLDYRSSDYFTCSEDRKVRKLNLLHEENLQEYELDSVPVDFFADLGKGKVYVASTKTGILVLDSSNLVALMSVSASKICKASLSGNGVMFAGCLSGIVNVYKESVLVTSLLLHSKTTSLKYSQLRKEVLIGNEAGYLSIWTRTGKLLKTWKAHEKSVVSLEITGNYLMSGGNEGSILLWQLPIFWVDPDFEELEKLESEIQAKTTRVLTTQQKIKEMDDLKGWDKL